MSLLAMACVAFGGVHAEITASINALSATGVVFSWPKITAMLIRWPVSLHAGWLAAATLLNLNAWANVSKCSLSTQISLAFASAYLGFALAAAYAFKSQVSYN